jgi:MFS family permease
MAIATIEGAIVAGFIAFIEVWLVPVLVDDGIGLPGYQVGWLSILPFMAMLGLSPFAPRIIRALGGNKAATIATSVFQVITLTLLAAPLLLHAQPWAKPVGLCLAILTNTVGSIAGPAYFGWMGDLIPRSIRGRYWSSRMRVLIGAKIAFAALFMWWDSASRDHGWLSSQNTLLVMILVAVASRLASVALLMRQPDAPTRKHTLSRPLPPAPPTPSFGQALWRTELGRWTAVWAVLHFGVMLAGPFFQPYMLADQPLGLELRNPPILAWRYSILIYTATFVRMLTLPAMGRLVDRFGPAAVLRTSVLVIMFVPIVWATSTSLASLLFIEVMSGLGWCAAECAVGVLLLSCHHDANLRARLISYHQMPIALVAMSATWTGMELIGRHALPQLLGSDYRTLFVISMLLRLPAVVLAWRLLPGLSPVPKEWIGVWRLIPGLRPTLTLSRGVMRYFRRGVDDGG